MELVSALRTDDPLSPPYLRLQDLRPWAYPLEFLYFDLTTDLLTNPEFSFELAVD